MDPVIHRSERHRSDMLLDLSGLTRKRRVEEQASINNESDFDKVADADVIQQSRVHLRESRKRPKEKGKDPHRLREGGKHSDNGKSGTSACSSAFQQTSTSSRTTTTGTTRLNKRILIEHTVTRLTLEVTAEKKFWAALSTRKHDTFSPYVALNDVSTFEAARLDAHAPVADRQDNDLDGELAYSWSKPKNEPHLPFGEEKGKSKGKGKFPVRPSCSPLENRRQRTEEL